jgi:hypothetical protein
MADIKHIGRIKNNGKKCIVVYRTLPGDAFNCLVILTESLTPSYHDALINLVEGNAAQSSSELSEVLARSIFPDGTTMLPSLHKQGFLVKVPTDKVEMTPNTFATVVLAELNQLIAEQKGVSVQDLWPVDEVKEVATAKDISPADISPTTAKEENEFAKTTSSSTTTESTENLGPEQLAKKYRSDADRLSKEAAQLRRMAEELVPTKKKVANA